MPPSLDDYQYQFGESGVVLDAQGMYDLLSIEGLDMPETRVVQNDRDGAHGEFIYAQFQRGRTVTINGAVKIADDQEVQQYIDTLKASFPPTVDAQPFYYKHPGVVQRLVFGNSLGLRHRIDETWNTKYVEFQVQIICEDPRIYESTTLSQGPLEVPVASGGLDFPVDFPFSFDTVSSGGPVSVNNVGNRETYPIYTFVGPLVNPRVRNVTTGDELKINYSLSTGQIAEAVTATRTIYIDGANRTDTRDSTAKQFPYLVPGLNGILFAAESGTGTLTVDFRSAWW